MHVQLPWKLPDGSPMWPYHLTLPAGCGSSGCSKSSPTLDGICFIDFHHPGECAVEYSVLDLHFTSHQWGCTTFYISIGHRKSYVVKGMFPCFCLFFCCVACPFLTLDINLFLLYTLQISSPFLQFAFSFSCCLLVKWCFQVSVMVQFANLCFMGRAWPVPYKKGNLLCV